MVVGCQPDTPAAFTPKDIPVVAQCECKCSNLSVFRAGDTLQFAIQVELKDFPQVSPI